MRLFIAIHLSEEQKDALIDVLDQIFNQGIRGNYTTEDNLHLTLAFIGEYPDADAILEALENVDFSPFSITLNGYGNFSDLWWVGLKSSQELQKLTKKIRRALVENDIPYDKKKFSAHITILRRADSTVAGITVPQITATIDHFSLMRSDRGKRGMIYTEIGRIEAYNNH